MSMKGIDISTYQRNVDFKKLKAAGVQFVIIRAGYGDVLSYPGQKDAMFESHYKGAKDAGLYVGAYWYMYATTTAGAKREAQGFIQTIKGKQFDMPVYLDLEEKSQFNTGRDNCSAMVTAFCSEMEKAGYFTGLYISRSPLQQYIKADVAKKYALWVAEYASKCNYSGTIGMWQYTSTARYNGYNSSLDADVCYVDYPSVIKNDGKNGYTKPKAKKALDSEGFKRGDKSLGVYALKQRLIALGYSMKSDSGFGSGTEKAVNSLLKKWGYKENGIAGEKFMNFVMK